MKPAIAPDVSAALTSAIPSRLLKKLDAEPELAAKWTWTDTTITTDKGETVTLTLDGGIVRAVACTCLLQPKCLHIAAVVALLPPAEEETRVAPVVVAQPALPLEEAPEDSRSVATRAFRIVSDVLATGAETTGAFAQAELLRSIHACRAAGLHRLAATQTRILRSVRELRADKPEFALPILATDLREALATAYAVAAGDASPAAIGTARRDYEPIGNLRLRGFLTEAIVARTGYAGAVTYLLDDKGTIYTRSDVMPGDAGRAAAAYDASAAIGDAVLAHRDLCRAGLFVSDATASADGRLGAGARVRAVRASEPSRWTDDAIAARFAAPLADQLARLASHDGTVDELRPAGWDLVFLTGTIVGGSSALVAVDTDDGGVILSTHLHHKTLPAHDNLVALARSAGLHIRFIARARLAAPRRLELLAISPGPDETRIPLVDALHGRANIHYDRVAIPPLGATAPLAVPLTSEPPDDLLSPLRRRVERVVLGGIATLPTHAIHELARDASLLADRSLTGGADALRDLAALAHDATRSATGVRRAVDRPAFARAWLRASLYEAAAKRRLALASW